MVCFVYGSTCVFSYPIIQTLKEAWAHQKTHEQAGVATEGGGGPLVLFFWIYFLCHRSGSGGRIATRQLGKAQGCNDGNDQVPTLGARHGVRRTDKPKHKNSQGPVGIAVGGHYFLNDVRQAIVSDADQRSENEKRDQTNSFFAERKVVGPSNDKVVRDGA
jgi:hypothetical protein